MLKKINPAVSWLIAVILMFSSFQAIANEDDYIVGLSAFRDGLYEISAPSFEAYLAGETEARKANYAHYLLYRIYLDDEKYEPSIAHLLALDDVDDRRFDRRRMGRDKMLLLTKTDCGGATDFLAVVHDEESINYYLDSECKPDREGLDTILKNVRSTETMLKIVANFSDDVETVNTIFDLLELDKIDDKAKKYFALYFYKHEDDERFAQVRAVYEDAEIVGIDLDKLWQSGDKDAFIQSYEQNKSKYKLTGVNACRAIDVYKKKGKEFDCNIINECMQKYSVEFVKVKGACLVKSGDKEKVTAFIDSLKPSIFKGMCGYGEYVFHNQLYAGKSHNKFYQCDERYKIAEILMNKKEYQPVVNMFFKKDKDMDRFYAASALRKLGKLKAADSTAARIKDESLLAKYKGGNI